MSGTVAPVTPYNHLIVRDEIHPLEMKRNKIELMDGLAKAKRRVEGEGGTILRWGAVQGKDTGPKLKVGALYAIGNHYNIDKVPYHLTHGYHRNGAKGIAVIQPTGMGLSHGGGVGDGAVVAKMFRNVTDFQIVHPNVVNGGDTCGIPEKGLYLEGLTLDEFFSGRVTLGMPKPLNRIGLIIDRLSDAEKNKQMVAHMRNAFGGSLAVMGMDADDIVACPEKIQNSVKPSGIGDFSAKLENAEVLLEAAKRLHDPAHCREVDAIAIATDIGGITPEMVMKSYRGEDPVNPYGGAEANVSHFVTHKTGLLTAHGPVYGSIGIFGVNETVDRPARWKQVPVMESNVS